MYSKPSDTHCYLTPNSCHQTHMVTNIPNNTARRFFQNNSQFENYISDKAVFTDHLINRGYNGTFVKDAFDKVEKLNRKTLYKQKSANTEKKICLPLIIDTNPALPPVAKIINKHKSILALDPHLNKVIPSNSIFVSYRSAKTIKDLLISSNRPINITNHSQEHPQTNVQPIVNDEHNLTQSTLQPINNALVATDGCVKCKSKRCYMCKNYLVECNEFSSFHTQQIFKQQSKISCSTEIVIYKIDCITHCKSYVGYTTTNIKLRFSNNKTHLKAKNISCEIVKHLNEQEHNIDFSSTSNYDCTLSKHVNVTLLEKVEVDPTMTKADIEAKCEAREGYWQTQLKSMSSYGGLNKKDSRKYVSRRQQERNKKQ